MPQDRLELWMNEFALDPELIYLNHAAIAPWPKRTCDAVQRFAQENYQRGASGYLHWLEVEQQLRQQAAQLLNAESATEIALLKNTSEALSMVAYGVDWQAGDSVVSIADDFPSNRIVWESLANQDVRSKQVKITVDTADPEAMLMAACDESTRLLAVSSVQYHNGLRLDLERLGAFCQQQNILFCIDTIQSLGVISLDVQRCQADFVMADGHKWLLASEGLAIFYCRTAQREQLQLKQFGWHMVEHRGDYDRTDWQPANSSQRFECGSPNMLGIYALSASLSLIEEVGLDFITTEIQERTDRLIELIDQAGFQLLSPRPTDKRAGIVSFLPADSDPQQLYTKLMQQGVICAKRGGGIRFSPHCHTTAEALQQAIALVKNHL